MCRPATAITLLLLVVERCGSLEEDLPEHLIDCYTSQTLLYPKTLRSLIDLIRELEGRQGSSDPASLAALLLYQFSVDGIERNPGATPGYRRGVVPFTVSGTQRYRDRVLKQNFLPADYINTPHLLSHLKKCSLHMMVSSSVDLWERGDENTVCPRLEQQKQWFTGEPFGNKMSSCPIEMGVVSYNDQTISPNRIFAAVLAGLSPVYLQVETVNTTEFVAPLSSIWASTLAGDLANVALMQDVGKIIVGAEGYWNDSILHTNYYLIADRDAVARRQWQLTNSHILADIDGLMIALQAEKYKHRNMKLSQLLESFYKGHSSTGSGSNACGRRHFFKQQILTRLPLIHHQSLQMAMLMRSMCTECVYQDRAALESGIKAAVNSLRTYLDENLAGTECESTRMNPRVKLYVIFDSTYTSYDKLRFFMRLAEMVDVYEYGSRITLINGQTGAMVVDDASTTGQLYSDWLNASHLLTGVEYLDVSRSLMTVQEIMTRNKYKKVAGYRGEVPAYSHVTVVLAASSTVRTGDLQTARKVLASLLHLNPEQRVFFLSSALMMPEYEALIRNSRVERRCQVLGFHPHHSDQQNRDLLKSFTTARRELIPEKCTERPEDTGQRSSTGISRYSELLEPYHWYRYILEPEYMCAESSSSRLDLQFQLASSAGGEVEICLGKSEHEEQVCKYLRHGTLSLTHDLTCSLDSQRWRCPPLYLQLRANRSHTCYEAGCRSGSEVKVNLQVTGISCLSSDGSIFTCSAASLAYLDKAVLALSQYFSLIILINIIMTT